MTEAGKVTRARHDSYWWARWADSRVAHRRDAERGDRTLCGVPVDDGEGEWYRPAKRDVVPGGSTACKRCQAHAATKIVRAEYGTYDPNWWHRRGARTAHRAQIAAGATTATRTLCGRWIGDGWKAVDLAPAEWFADECLKCARIVAREQGEA